LRGSEICEDINVLHVEDDPQYLEMVEGFLTEHIPDAEIIKTTNVDEALDIISEKDIDCILSDFQMPETDGIKFLEEVRSINENLPFILLTGKGSEEIASKAISKGATDYFRKGSRSNFELLAKRLENAIINFRLREERTKILERVGDAFFALDKDLKFTYANSNAEELLEEPRDDLIGQKPWKKLDIENNRFKQKCKEALEEQTSAKFEMYHPNNNSWLSVKIYPSETGLSVYFEDISQKKRQEKESALRKSMIEAVEGSMFLVDDKGRFKWVNDRAAEKAGYSKEELVGMHISEIIGEEYSKEIQKKKKLLDRDDKARMRLEPETAEGNKIPTEINFTPHKLGNGNYGIIGVARDLSKQQEELQKYRNLVDSFSDITLVLDTDLKIETANRTLNEVADVESEEVEGENIKVLNDKGIFTEEEYRELEDRIKSLSEADEDSVTFELKSGADNTEARYFEVTCSKFYDEGGNLSGFTCLLYDITSIEEKRISNKERLNEFSSLVSHDLRNPLNLAQGYLDLARESEDEEDYEVIQKAHDRMEKIIEELLIITSQPEEVGEELFELENVFEEAYYFTGDESSSYEIVENKEIYGDRTGVISMFENLISNSIEHNKEGISIRVGSIENGFYYEDTGQGIDEDKRDKVFEYGHSSSEEGRGIGLSIIKRIIEVNDWKFELKQSEEGGMRLEIITE